ncbi:hypothetical protein QTN25_006925 [Entamoeba marina]
MSLPENDIGEKINYIICDDDEIDYERRKETQKEQHGPKMQVSHNSDDDAIEDDYAMEEDESDSTDNADSTTSCDSSEEGHRETNINTTNDVCPEIRETRYVCGDFDYVEDNYKNKKSDKSESRKWEPKKGTLGKCKVRRYINEQSNFIDVDVIDLTDCVEAITVISSTTAVKKKAQLLLQPLKVFYFNPLYARLDKEVIKNKNIEVIFEFYQQIEKNITDVIQLESLEKQ